MSWTAAPANPPCTITSYSVYRSTTSGFTPSSSNLVASGVTGTTYSNTGLAASTTYYYLVEALDSFGASAASNQASAETQSGSGSCSAVPTAPTGLTATASSSSAIGLSWTAVTPPANCSISSYSVYGSTSNGFTPSSSNLISNAITGTSYSNTGLSASTTYYYVVEATDAEGNSAASTQASAETQAAASGAEVVAIAAGGPAQSNASGGDYSFVADEDYVGGGGNGAVTATINLTQPGANAAPMGVYQNGRAGVSTYTIPGLTAGSTYTVLLHFAETYFTAAVSREFDVAINGTTVLTNLDVYATVGKDAALVEIFTATANSSGQIVIAFTAGAANQPLVMGIEIRSASSGSCSAVPSAPTGLTAAVSSSSAIGLNWSAVTPPANCTISSYKVYGSTTSGFTPSSSNLIASTTGTSYSNTGLAASTTYYYVVEAVDADGSSVASTQASAETSAASCSRGSLGTDRADSDGVFLHCYRVELDGGNSSGELLDQLVQRLWQQDQRLHSVVEHVAGQWSHGHDIFEHRLDGLDDLLLRCRGGRCGWNFRGLGAGSGNDTSRVRRGDPRHCVRRSGGEQLRRWRLLVRC